MTGPAKILAVDDEPDFEALIRLKRLVEAEDQRTRLATSWTTK